MIHSRPRLTCVLVGLLIGCLGCQSKPPEPPPIVSDTMAQTILRLAREQLTSPDPVAIERIQICETSRVGHLVGIDSLLKILGTVGAVIKATSTSAERERVRDSLSGKEYVAEVGCDTMAAAGLLGGPWLWEVPRPLPGDSTWRKVN